MGRSSCRVCRCALAAKAKHTSSIAAMMVLFDIFDSVKGVPCGQR
jgi:hypothetical protein